MLRKLFTTTALALLVGTPAFAQDAATTPAATPGQDLLTSGYMDAENDFLASRVFNQPVYSSAANDAEEIGTVNDLVLMADGNIGAVIIGVGGFLGIGEKNVAVDVSQLNYVQAEDGTERWVLETTREALEAAPAFEWVEDEAQMDTAAAPAADPMAPADPNAAAGAETAAVTPPADQPMNAADPNAAAPATETAAAPTTEPMAPASPDAMAPATDTAAAQQPADPNAMAGGMETATETAATPAADPNAAPVTTFDRTTMTGLDITTLTAEELIGTNVIGPENTEIAEVGDFILTEDGKIDALLVDFGGFLGIGEKRVAVGIDNLEFTTDEGGNRYVWLNVTREQLDAAVDYNQDTYATERDTQRLVVSQS